MRYDALPLLCPTQQPISWQIETNEYDDNGFPKTDIVSADGQFFERVSINSYEVKISDKPGFYIYTFRGTARSTALPCKEMYFATQIGNKVFYSERFKGVDVNLGYRTDVVLTISGNDLTFTETRNTVLSPTSEHWQYFREGLGWEDIVANGTTNPVTVDVSLFWQSTPANSVYAVRRRLVYADFEVVAYFNLQLRTTVSASMLIRKPDPKTLTQNQDLYLLEYWNSTDDFGFLYSDGFRQRLYVLAAYDGITSDENDTIDVKPTGFAELRSSVLKPRSRLVIGELPDYSTFALESIGRHDNLNVVNLRTGVSVMASEVQYEPGQGDNPLAAQGTLSFVTNVLYKQGARANRVVTTADPSAPGGGIDNPDGG